MSDKQQPSKNGNTQTRPEAGAIDPRGRRNSLTSGLICASLQMKYDAQDKPDHRMANSL